MTSSSSSWHARAACRGLDPELFFPERGTAAGPAKAICATCPVKAECLEAGQDEHYGVWGGMTRHDRQLATKGYRSNRVPVRGCWMCSMPTEKPNRYCSDECRAQARRESQRRYHARTMIEGEAS